MDNMLICGSCHTLVMPSEGAIDCPRCLEPIDPDAEFILKKFIDHGIVEYNRKGGVTLSEAREAASKVFGDFLLTKIKLNLHHLGNPCVDCSTGPKPDLFDL